MELDEARKAVHGWDKTPTDALSPPVSQEINIRNFIAFYKGDLVDDVVLAWAIELATYGYITEAGMDLNLIPKRYMNRLDETSNPRLTNMRGEDERQNPGLSLVRPARASRNATAFRLRVSYLKSIL